MPKYPFKVLAFLPGSVIDTKEIPVPYATTALLYAELQRKVGEAAGIVRYSSGVIQMTVYPKLHMARCTSATHGFIITRDHSVLDTGLRIPGMKALNPDIAFSGDEALLDIPSGTLAEHRQPMIWTRDEVAASAHSDAVCGIPKVHPDWGHHQPHHFNREVVTHFSPQVFP